jgi:hypothetical protein
MMVASDGIRRYLIGYDLGLIDPVTKETLTVDERHFNQGGMYCIGGTNEMRYYVTYNYAPFYYEHMDEDKGLRVLCGMSGAESIPLLKSTIAKLKDDVTTNYWDETEGNAKRALYGLLALAQMRPDGIWDGD